MSPRTQTRTPPRSLLLLASAALTIGIAILPVGRSEAVVRNAEDLMIVDCLLPGQLRRLGRQATYLTARRPIRTTQADCQIRGGEYVEFDRANYQTALRVWMEQAMAGDAEAQNNVGEIYAKGLGVEPDYGMAFQWFKKAADQGYSRARINLAYLYEQGLGVAQDQAMALNLYREAAGIEDELMYASVVEVQLEARDQQIGALQQQVQQEQAQSAELRQQVEQLQRELEQRRRALQQSQQELQATQSRLAQARQSQDSALTRLLENQLASQEQEINSQRTQIASLERRGGGGGGNTMFAGTTSFQILQPAIVPARGRPTAVVSGAGRRQVVGRVNNPRLMREVTVNGVATQIAPDGTFTAQIDVPASGASVRVAATDQRGAAAQYEFTMMPGAAGATAASPAAASAPTGSLPRDVRLGRYFAVVIGNNTYRDSRYQSLRSAGNDATAVANLLRTRYGFQTTLVLNGTRLEILSALNDMRERLTDQDNLLIYYAGHGEVDRASGQGYWIPTDGAAGNNRTWISNAAISDILNSMRARHVLVVADSCYSGTLARASSPVFDSANMPADRWAGWVRTMASGRSRSALTSGGVMPVPDTGSGNHSYFARAFINALTDNRRLMESQGLYQQVSVSLALNAVNSPIPQTPSYSPIRFAGHESGTFFFSPRG